MYSKPFAIGTAVLSLFFAGAARGGIMGPYIPDADTLHLWHMNEPSTPVIDMGSDGLHLTALRNGATLGNASYKRFGTALSTYDGGPDAVTDAGKDAYLSARPLVDGLSDNVLMTYTGPSGAFTYEALVRIDFDPAVVCGTNSDGVVRGNYMQIVNLDADESSNRICQFRLDPAGTLKENPVPLLEFINLNKDKQIQNITARIPTSGPDAINMGSWYHVAVTYTGTPNEPDNIKFYWTLMDASRSSANLIGTGQMARSLPVGCSPDFAIGQTGRQSPVTLHPNQNFVGLIDEVRISAVARSATQMMFGGPAVLAQGASSSSQSGTSAQAAANTEPRSIQSGDRWNGVFWLMCGALLVIVGFLGWLVFVIKRLLTRVPMAVVPEARLAAENQVMFQSDSLAANIEGARRPVTIKGAALASEVTGAGTEIMRKSAVDNPPETDREYRVSAEPANDVDLFRPHKDTVETQGEAGFRGVLRKVGLQDLIQMECLSRKSCILEISNQDLRGKMHIEHGEIVHAAVGQLSGEQALIKLLSLSGGEFSIKGFEAPEKRTIHGSWIQLLMEAARQRDEGTVHITANGTEEKKPAPAHSSNTTTTEDLLAMATMLTDHPDVREILVCSKEGKTLYSSKCQDAAGREQVCSDLSRVAKTASDLLPLGKFENLEILRTDSKTFVQAGEDGHLLIQMESNVTNAV